MNDHCYLRSCLDFNPGTVRYLDDMLQTGRQVSRATFVRNTHELSRLHVETSLGYHRGTVSITKDWAISYYKGTYRGLSAYWMVWSAIEFIFTHDGEECAEECQA